MPSSLNDLPQEISDQKDGIEDGLIDEIEALEEMAEANERPAAPGGLPKDPVDQAEPAPETL